MAHFFLVFAHLRLEHSQFLLDKRSRVLNNFLFLSLNLVEILMRVLLTGLRLANGQVDFGWFGRGALNDDLLEEGFVGPKEHSFGVEVSGRKEFTGGGEVN